MKLKLHKTKSSIVGRLQKQLTATSLNELSIYHRANVWVNKCQTLLTHPEETDQHRYSTGALSLTTCWIMSNIRWHFLHSFIRQFQNIWLSGFLDVFDCVHQPLSRSGSPPFHAGQEACNQLVCAWTLRAAAHSLICGGRWEPEWLNNVDQQTKTVPERGWNWTFLPTICGIYSFSPQFQITESFVAMLISKLLLNRPVIAHALNILGFSLFLISWQG